MDSMTWNSVSFSDGCMVVTERERGRRERMGMRKKRKVAMV
jgi:hypothetical protein